MKDQVDGILQQWKQIKPELDCSSMGVVGRLRRVDNQWKQQLDTVFKKQEMSSIEFDILATLRRSQIPLTPTELYKTLMLSSGAMSTRIEMLVKRGLIERVYSEQDRRSCKVMLTDQGITIIDLALHAHLENMDNLLKPLNNDEKNQLAALLKKLLLAQQ
ncbi:MarR family transcriptional regulator [Psychromonas sp. SR45-3]|nr:MarR family transcriptional regulator [Psychromonas sp. SR45-3]